MLSEKILDEAVKIKRNGVRIKKQWQSLDKEEKDFLHYWFENQACKRTVCFEGLAIEDEADPLRVADFCNAVFLVDYFARKWCIAGDGFIPIATPSG